MVTINDVAKAAGVSKGTVDRVIHNRGEVSQKSREKVMKVIEELGYQPNVYASILASNKRRTIVCLIPESLPGDFWALTAKGVAEAQQSASRYSIAVDIVTYDQYDITSFRDACRRAISMGPSGVVMAPMFHTDTLNFVHELKAKNIPYVYIDSKIDDDDDYFAYYGMPMFKSGYLCADLLMAGTPSEKVYIIRIERDKNNESDPTAARRKGFKAYMAEHFPETEIRTVHIDPKDEEARFRKLDEAFSDPSEKERRIVMFNSRVHLVADYIRRRKVKGCRIVGFDFLERNVHGLKDGIIQTLIAQHSDRQVAAAILSLVDKFIVGEFPQKKDVFTQMDILNKYNCDYYM